MTKSLSLAFTLLVVLLFSTCHDDDDGQVGEPEPTPNPYANCCGAEPGEYSSEGINFYVPNAFTPDNNGFNDIFVVHAGFNTSENFHFRSLVITDEEGNELFRKTEFQPGDVISGWDGQDSNGAIHEGFFNYSLTVENTLGNEETFTGQACSILCEADSSGNFPDLDDAMNCTFSLNHNGEGEYDPNLPTGENSSCF